MPAPAAPADPVRAIFEKLADEYKFSSKIVDKFVSLKLESLADFRFFVEPESEIEKAFIDGIPDLDQPRLQLARVRHAWSACVAETKAGEARKMKEAEKADDEEFVLPPGRIDEMKQAFFKRYHLCLTPGEWPSDRLLSKVWKQLDKRSLEVQDLWLVKSLTYQKTTPVKKRKVAEGLWAQDDTDDHDREGGTDMSSYFQRMRIYFMALAIVGASHRQGAPGAPETLGVDSANYVLLPWDLLQKYQVRAEKAAGQSPLASRIQAIIQLDTEERAEWAHRFATDASFEHWQGRQDGDAGA